MLSLKCLLVVSFILLMAIAGFLGYFLTDIQSRQSLNEVAEMGVHDQVVSVLELITSQLRRGQIMIIQEINHFTNRGIYLNDWVAVWEQWRPFTLDMVAAAPDWVPNTGLLWLPNHGVIFSLASKAALFVDFNNTICTDPVHFPQSNCSISGLESYPLDSSWQPIWSSPAAFSLPYNITEQVFWKTGAMSRLDRWRANTSANLYNLGYSEIMPFLEANPPALNLQINGNLLNRNGDVVGQIFKSLQLDFLGAYLKQLTIAHTLFSNDGRAFSFELGNGLLTGASHGPIYALETSTRSVMRRFSPSVSPDPIISAAGKTLTDFLRDTTHPTNFYKFRFSAYAKRFLCIAKPVVDPYGLSWMACVVLSLTDLFAPMNEAALRMVGWTALAVVLLSLLAGLLISWLVVRSLHQLSDEMGDVAEMNLEAVEELHHRSVFYEITTMQAYFYKMVQNLKEYRAFLPSAILNSTRPTSSALSHTGQPFHNLTATDSKPKLYTPRLFLRTPSGKENSLAAPDQSPTHKSELLGAEHPKPTLSARGRKRSALGVTNEHLLEIPETPSSISLKEIGMLTKRSVSMLVMDMSGCHRWLGQPERLVSVHSWALQKSSEIIQQNGGMPLPFLGDKLMVFWNVRVLKSDHPTLCVTTAMQLASCFKDLPPFGDVTGAAGLIGAANEPCRLSPSGPVGGQELRSLSEELVETSASILSFRIACTMGAACFGTMGTQTSRAFTILSPCVSRAMLLEKLGKLIPFGVVCDGLLHERVQFHFVTRLVGLLAFPDRVSEHRVFELLAPRVRQGNADEWMYELGQNDNGSPTANSQDTSDPLGLRQIYDPGFIRGTSSKFGSFRGPINRPSLQPATQTSTEATAKGNGDSAPPLPLPPHPLLRPTPSGPPQELASRDGGGGAEKDAVAIFYQSHEEQLRKWLDPQWGLAVPLNLWL